MAAFNQFINYIAICLGDRDYVCNVWSIYAHEYHLCDCNCPPVNVYVNGECLHTQNKLDGLPEGSKLALRDLSLTFPVGLADICRQAFQVLQNRLLERDKSTSKKSRENVAYNNVVSLLVAAREPLPMTAFRPTNDEVV